MSDPTTIDSLIAAVGRAPNVSDATVMLKAGDVLGTSYVIDRELGRGGMGVVYRATDRTLGREVAIKVMRPDRWSLLAQADLRTLFDREARATAKLKHPSIVTAYYAGQDDSGMLFLVLELLRGESLNARLARGPLAVEEAVGIAEEVADAVAHAHGQGVLHRDLKPQNVFLCDDHRVCLLDFGLAALYAAGQPDARSRSGTPSSMAPEQWSGEVQDERTDVWAMGMLLYRMLTGAHPPMVSSVDDLERWLATLSTQDVPPALARVVRHALAFAPAERFPSARAMLVALRKARPARPRLPSARISRRSVRRDVAIAGGVVALLGGAAVALLVERETPAAAAPVTPAEITGMYRHPIFGEMYIEVVGDQIRGASEHDDGLFEGRLVDNELIGMWCELPTRQLPSDAGELRIRFVRTPNGLLGDGRWRYGYEGGWDENYDQYRSPDPPTNGALLRRVAEPNLHCPKPR
jgi:eukaryotic-like serine/threonine-protein kinase